MVSEHLLGFVAVLVALGLFWIVVKIVKKILVAALVVLLFVVVAGWIYLQFFF